MLMSNRTQGADKAIREAWKQEQELVRQGQGTRDWTPQQQRDILERGKAYDTNGKAFEGHHKKSVEKYPQYQGDPDNIQFLTRKEHIEAHGGSTQNPTNGFYNPSTGETIDYGIGPPQPNNTVNLSHPVCKANSQTRDNSMKQGM